MTIETRVLEKLKSMTFGYEPNTPTIPLLISHGIKSNDNLWDSDDKKGTHGH
jgi:hypothetical protein